MKTKWEYWKESELGDICTVKDFEVKRMFPAVMKAVRKYGIKYNPDYLMPTDELMEKTWNAALDLLSEVGVLCVDTERLINFDRDDIVKTLAQKNESFILGEGRDAVVVQHRKVADSRMPIIIGGPISVPISEEMIDASVESYVREPEVDVYDAGVYTHLDGIAAKAGSLWEMEVEKREVHRLREASRRAGRPGMPIMGSSYTDPISTIGTCNKENGYRPSDTCHCYIMPNLKTDYESLCRAHHYRSYGLHIHGMGTSFIGGFAGGPEGAAVMAVAEAMAAVILYDADMASMWTPDLMYPPGLAQRRVIWATGLALGTWATYAKNPAWGPGPYQPYAGPCTEMYLYEITACTIKTVMCGAQPTFGGGRMGTQVDYFGGAQDIRFIRDICRATIKLDRDQANDVLQKLLPKYEEHIKAKDAPIGKKYQECNDPKTFLPTQEYVDLCEKVKKELEEIGLDFS